MTKLNRLLNKESPRTIFIEKIDISKRASQFFGNRRGSLASGFREEFRHCDLRRYSTIVNKDKTLYKVTIDVNPAIPVIQHDVYCQVTFKEHKQFIKNAVKEEFEDYVSTIEISVNLKRTALLSSSQSFDITLKV